MSSISIVHQKLDVEDVRLITVSDIVQDTGGNWIRLIKFYGDPVANGAPTSFVEIASRSANKDDLTIQAPGFKY
jgi:hypothetical protein